MLLPVVLWLGERLSPRPKAIPGRDPERLREVGAAELRLSAAEWELGGGMLSLLPEKVFDKDDGKRENRLDGFAPPDWSVFFRLKPKEVRRDDSCDGRGAS